MPRTVMNKVRDLTFYIKWGYAAFDHLPEVTGNFKYTENAMTIHI